MRLALRQVSRLLSEEECCNHLRIGALGLLILTIVGFVPYLGGLVYFVVVCLGLGALAVQLYRASRRAMIA